jgi:pyridinium-3,5-bisthiocarboxylic acid mononucleotide nickel chelatase
LVAGTKDFRGRANALRVILADASTRDLGSDVATEELVELVCDIDDMTPEYLAAVADRVRDAGALDVTLLSVAMKRGRPGSRIEVLCRTRDVVRLEEMLLVETTTIGVRQRTVRRRALAREVIKLTVLGHEIAAKLVTLPTGRRRAKPEFVDVQRVALATGRPLRDISSLAAIEAERYSNA